MTLTPAKKQRLYRERQKAEEVKASLALTDMFRTPFFETLPGDFSYSSDFSDNCELIGIPTPEFVDDRGTEFFTHYSPQSSAEMIEHGLRSLGRAEMMISGLVEAAVDLAHRVNSYKRAEIKARLAEIEASDLLDPTIKKAALQDATRLNKMLDQLDKQIRITFPQWKVAG